MCAGSFRGDGRAAGVFVSDSRAAARKVPLMRREQRRRRQMILQVDRAQLALRLADLRGEVRQGRGGDRLASEGPVKRLLARDQLLSCWHGLGLHLLRQLTHPLALRVGELQRVGQFQRMQGTRITVEFGCKCESHAAARAQIGNLLLAEGLHGALLQTRVRHLGMLMLRQRDAANEDRRRRDNDGFHVASSIRITRGPGRSRGAPCIVQPTMRGA